MYYNLATPAAVTQKIFNLGTSAEFCESNYRSLAGMKNIYEVLREKEMNLARLRTEVEALRFVAPLLIERSDEHNTHPPDMRWTPPIERNKWPLTVDNPAPNYLDS